MYLTKAHHGLDAWQVAMTLVTHVYAATRSFPREELYGLVTQVRRSAVSVPSNIAEGAGRTGPREFAKFLSISRGSLAELETQLLIAVALGYVRRDDVAFSLIDRVSRLLTGLQRSLRNAARLTADR
jgi:four helix bundle protein